MENKYLIRDWVLYDFEFVSFTSTDAATGQEFVDTKQQAKCFRVFGTKEQLNKLAKNYNIDEQYTYEKLFKNSYWKGICFSDDPNSSKPSLKEYNERYEQDYKRYLSYYRQNKNKPIKIALL